MKLLSKTPKQRLLRNVIFVLICGLFGGCIGWLAGWMSSQKEHNGFHIHLDIGIATLAALLSAMALVFILFGLYYIRQVYRLTRQMDATEDEEESMVLEKAAGKAYAMAGIFVYLLNVPFFSYLGTIFIQGAIDGSISVLMWLGFA